MQVTAVLPPRLPFLPQGFVLILYRPPPLLPGLRPPAPPPPPRPLPHHDRQVAPRPLLPPLPQRRPLGLDRPVLQEAPQVVGQLLGRGVALGRLLGESLVDDRLQFCRHRRVPSPHRYRLVPLNLAQQ